MRPGRLRVVTRLLGLTLLLPACGADFLWVDTMGKTPELVTTTTSTTTTTTAPAPPPPPPPAVKLPPPPPRAPKPVAPPPPPPPPPPPKAVPLPGDSPLTGIGVGGYASGHPALVVKIDNVGSGPGGARPQTGINEADVMLEEMVEGGFTRLAGIYHSTEADPVGPIRSARSTDIALLAPLYHPLFAYSGANRDFQKLVRESSMIDVGVDNYPGKYFRGGGKKSPHNLYSNTSALHSLASPDAQAPPPLFSYRQEGTRPSEPNALPVSRVQATWTYQGKSSTTVSYDWDAGTGTWTRIQNGALHVDAAGRKVAPTNVIFQFVTYHDTGYVDSSGAHVPEADVVGSGEAWILSAGYLAPVRWEKRNDHDVTVFRGMDGRYARLLPGRTWVELAQVSTGSATERPPDANDQARPVAPPAPDGTGPSPPETTTTTTGPQESTTSTMRPPEESTTTTQPAPVTTTSVTVPPVGTDPTTSSSTSTTDTTAGNERKSHGTKDQGKASTTPASSSSSSVASGPASAALIGLLLLVAPLPGEERRRRRRR